MSKCPNCGASSPFGLCSVCLAKANSLSQLTGKVIDPLGPINRHQIDNDLFKEEEKNAKEWVDVLKSLK